MGADMGLRTVKAKRSPYQIPGQHNTLTSTIVIGAEAANVILVTLTLKDLGRKTLAKAAGVRAWLSDSATTGAVIAAAPSGGVALGVGSVIAPVVAGKVLDVVTSTGGVARFDVTEVGAKTCYLWVLFPDGSTKVSGAITFA